MKNDQKTRKKNIILPTFEQPPKYPSNPTAARLVAIENRIAPLSENKKIRNTQKKQFTERFLTYIQNIKSLETTELKATQFSAHISKKALNALIAESEKRNESLATVLHQRYSKALERKLKRKPVFFFTFGYDKPEKKGDLREQNPEYSGLHIHALILLNEKEQDSRTRNGQAVRKALKSFNGKVSSMSFKKQEVFIQPKSQAEHFTTKYATEECDVKQAQYLAKNACEYAKNFKDKGKPYSASKSLLKRQNERIHETITVEPPKPQKETLKDGAITTPAEQQLVLTEKGLTKPAPVSDSLKRKIAEWNKQLTDNPESATAHAPPPPKESLDDMINNL